MSPLDTGYGSGLRLVGADRSPLGEPVNDHGSVGAYLRSLREARALTLGDVAEMTRIRKIYLQGLEEGNLSVLPSRPFAIGYVRAYGRALGVDGDVLAARFKKETPSLAEPLRGPTGVRHEDVKRSPMIIAMIGVVVLGVVLWNVVQRATAKEERAPQALPMVQPVSPLPIAPVVMTVAPPAPAPAEQNLPSRYETPGLPQTGDQTHSDSEPTLPTPPATFATKGHVFGAPGQIANAVALLAMKPTSVIVRGPAGQVYFARQLAVGEAFRAPVGQGLSAEVGDPKNVALYVGEASAGLLSAPQTRLDEAAYHAMAARRQSQPQVSAPVPGPTSPAAAPAAAVSGAAPVRP